jgi:monofunctional biosynthetic peptidoglycan transglycosylase
MFWRRSYQKIFTKNFNNGIAAKLGWLFVWVMRLLLLLLLVDLFYVTTIWPDWERIKSGPVPKSKFIEQYEQQRKQKGDPHLRWRPVPFTKIPEHLVRAVIVAEDSRFYQHNGFDLIAFREAMDYNLSQRRAVVGGSTISQQTVKNMFLNPSRNPIRKWHELLMTWFMERKLSKGRILAIYLNIAEFGRGIYGVEAASQHYWGISAFQISEDQAVELAATLPSPKKHNPKTQTKTFNRRVIKIKSWMTPRKEQNAAPLRMGSGNVQTFMDSSTLQSLQLQWEYFPSDPQDHFVSKEYHFQS